jgi:hypothetical protein
MLIVWILHAAIRDGSFEYAQGRLSMEKPDGAGLAFPVGPSGAGNASGPGPRNSTAAGEGARPT